MDDTATSVVNPGFSFLFICNKCKGFVFNLVFEAIQGRKKNPLSVNVHVVVFYEISDSLILPVRVLA